MRIHFCHAAWATAILLAGGGCIPSTEPSTERQQEQAEVVTTIYAVNYPLQYFAQRIGGPHVEVVFPVPPDRDPAYWIPTSKIVAGFQEADLILCNGASYAKWRDMVSLPAANTVDTTAEVRDQYIALEGTVTHSHGPGGEHEHGGTASTTWLDPELASYQADQVRRALTEIHPHHESEFRENCAALQRDLSEIDQAIAATVEGKTDRPILFSHPVYQYLIRRYGLRAKSLHWEPDQVPSPESWEELKSLLEEHPAQWLIWEASPVEDTVRRLEDLGVRSVVFEPCGNTPAEGDFMDVMRRNIENFRQVFAD
jgi:zinc transport system substrate-binding protein